MRREQKRDTRLRFKECIDNIRSSYGVKRSFSHIEEEGKRKRSRVGLVA